MILTDCNSQETCRQAQAILCRNGSSRKASVRSSQVKNFGRLVLHVVLSMMASALVYIIVTAVLVAPLFVMAPPGSFIRRLLGSFYGPEIWGPGLLLGFIVNRKLFDRSAFWVWAIGIAWLAYGVWEGCSLSHYPQSYPRKGTFLECVQYKFFGSNDSACGASECLEMLVFTVPALNSVTYSVGAWLGFRSRRLPSDESTQTPSD